MKIQKLFDAYQQQIHETENVETIFEQSGMVEKSEILKRKN